MAAGSKTNKVDDDAPWHLALVGRSRSWLRFVDKGWSTKKEALVPFIEAFSKTALWEHVPLLSVDGKAPRERGSLDDARTAVQKVKSGFTLLDGGKDTFDDEANAFMEVEVSGRSATITTAVRGKILASLGKRVLDDFFTTMRSLHDSVGDAAHFASAVAFTTWKDNTPEPDLSADWPLRAVADVLQPTRPKDESGDASWDAANVIAAAPAPRGATRTTHKGLIELRWLDDPSDGARADEAAVRHEAWIKTLVNTRPA